MYRNGNGGHHYLDCDPASTKNLENNNFQFTEIVQDHEIGDAWLWTHRK